MAQCSGQDAVLVLQPRQRFNEIFPRRHKVSQRVEAAGYFRRSRQNNKGKSTSQCFNTFMFDTRCSILLNG